MLKGLDPLLSPELLHLLARMGHGDDLALVDGNHPAETIARGTVSGALVRLPGVPVERALSAILTVLPIDDFTSDPLRLMQPVDAAAPAPEAVMDLQAAARQAGFAGHFAFLERFAFYDAARRAFGVVHCGDPRFYGNMLVRKGAIAGARP
jgi:L-fucose mutarotase